MRASWHALHADLVRSTNRHSFQIGYQNIRRTSAAVGAFGDPAALLDHLHDTSQERIGKSAVLRALVSARDHGSGDTADVLLLLALWPGLDAVHRRLLRDFADDPVSLTVEIASRFALAVRTLDLDRVTSIAETLIMNVERDIRRARICERKLTRSQVELIEDHHPVFGEDDCQRSYRADELVAGTELDLRLREIIGADSQLVIGVVLRGETRREAAGRLGIGHDAGRKRYQRAMSKLNAALSAVST